MKNVLFSALVLFIVGCDLNLVNDNSKTANQVAKYCGCNVLVSSKLTTKGNVIEIRMSFDEDYDFKGIPVEVIAAGASKVAMKELGDKEETTFKSTVSAGSKEMSMSYTTSKIKEIDPYFARSNDLMNFLKKGEIDKLLQEINRDIITEDDSVLVNLFSMVHDKSIFGWEEFGWITEKIEIDDEERDLVSCVFKIVYNDDDKFVSRLSYLKDDKEKELVGFSF